MTAAPHDAWSGATSLTRVVHTRLAVPDLTFNLGFNAGIAFRI